MSKRWLAHRNPAQFIEHADVVNQGVSVVARGHDGQTTQITPETSAAVIFGAGVAISSTALRHIVSGGCSIFWLASSGLALAAVTQADPLTASTDLLLRQVASVASRQARRGTAVRSLTLRFDREPPLTYTVEQLRGWEGIRVRKHYVTAATRRGIEWRGRVNAGDSDFLNAMISGCNAAVYSATEAACHSLGLSTSLGFLHTGQRSFVFDIADHFKATSSVERVFDFFANRDQSEPLPSSFQFARGAFPAIVSEVYARFYDVVDAVLVR